MAYDRTAPIRIRRGSPNDLKRVFEAAVLKLSTDQISSIAATAPALPRAQMAPGDNEKRALNAAAAALSDLWRRS